MAVFGVPGLTAPDGVQSASGDGRGVARPIAVWRTICHRRRRRLSDDDLVDLARAIWQERFGKSKLARGTWQERPSQARPRTAESRAALSPEEPFALQMRRLPAAK
jgi:hypothetical protein